MKTHLVRIIWEIDFVENLCSFMLNCFNFHLVRWILSLAMSQSFLESLSRIQSDGMTSCSQELVQVLHQVLTAGKQPRGQPHQLPSSLLRQSVAILSQLLHDLTVNFISKNFLKIINNKRIRSTDDLLFFLHASEVLQIFDPSTHCLFLFSVMEGLPCTSEWRGIPCRPLVPTHPY